MADKETRDLYIAAAVGGVGLVLAVLYLHQSTALAGGGAPDQTAPQLPASTSDAPALTNYNYNVAPYNPGPPITFAQLQLPAANGYTIPPPPPYGSATPGNTDVNGLGGGCCDDCGPIGNTFNDVNTGQFLSLLGLGGSGGA